MVGVCVPIQIIQIEMFIIDKSVSSGIMELVEIYMLKTHPKILILGLFSAFFAAAAFVLPKKPQNSPVYGSPLAQKLEVECAASHDTALAHIKAYFAISDDLWDEYLGGCHAKIAGDDLKGHAAKSYTEHNEPIVAALYKALLEYGINPERVSIKLVNSSDTPAQAVQALADDGTIIHRIELDLYRLNKLSFAIQKALIRHEIMHLLNYDSLEGSYIITMLYKLGYSAKALEKVPAMIAYRHQRELRADLLAGCDHPEVAQSLQEYFASYMKITDQDNQKLWTTHPSDKQRHEQLAQLLTKMDASSVRA